MLNKLGKQIIEINRVNGWDVVKRQDWQNAHKIPAILALIHSEVSEALESFRDGDIEHFKEECADIIIRTLDLMAGLGIDINAEVEAKLAKNKGRGFRHGGKRV